jgi:hypothetical protein
LAAAALASAGATIAVAMDGCLLAKSGIVIYGICAKVALKIPDGMT